MPLELLKVTLKHIILALVFLHDGAHLIHTGKLESKIRLNMLFNDD